MGASRSCQQLDFGLAGLRYELMRAPGAAAAAAFVTSTTHFAARRFEDHVSVISDLLSVAADDAVNYPPPAILTRSYTMADAEACAAVDSPSGMLAARLADIVMQGFHRISRDTGVADFLFLRRLLGSALLALPADSLLDCARGLGRAEALTSENVILLIPVPRIVERDLDVWSEINRFWRETSHLPWTRESYASVVASVLVTACMRLDQESGEVVRGISRPRTQSAMAAAWYGMPSGVPDAVPGMVGLVRRLSGIIIDHAMACRGAKDEFLGSVAGFLCPVSLTAFAGRFRDMAPRWSAELPARLESEKLVLVLGDAPAVVV